MNNIPRDPRRNQIIRETQYGCCPRVPRSPLKAHATSLTPHNPGLSDTLFPNKSVKLHSSRGPENVNITLYRYTGYFSGPLHDTMTVFVIAILILKTR